MADRNLTGAIYELKDTRQGPRRSQPSEKRNTPPDPSKIDQRPRAFDAFYAFGVALLSLAVLVQLIAIISYI